MPVSRPGEENDVKADNERRTALRHVVVWLRQDLRSADNTALLAACADPAAAVTALYAITPGQWQQHDVAGVRIDFELRHLRLLQADLAALNIPLVIIEAHDYAALVTVMADWLGRHEVDELHANRQYEINEQARDAALTAACPSVRCHWHDDLCILPPGSVRTGDQRYYTVFTPYKRNWLAQLATCPVRLLPVPAPRPVTAAVSTALPANVPGLASHVDPELAAHLWPVGETAAHDRLQAFIEEDGPAYDSRRDRPAINGTSTLSPYLAAGILSARQCLVAAWRRKARGGGSDQGLDTWISELCWRDFYKHILVGFPHVCRGHAFKRETDAIPWRHDEALFQAWCEGRTGFPIVDAAMRQLRETGWMHNRLRMITAMFLSKDLFIDWRWGERHFMRHLVDGDFSANNGGWQWSASTGNDAAPYFRIFNPLLQGQRFDPEGEFIRRFVPELASCDPRRIHEPHARGQSALFSRYPLPVVDHASARDHAVAQFKALGALPPG